MAIVCLQNMLVLVLHEEPQIRYSEFPLISTHVTGCRCPRVIPDDTNVVIPDAATVLVRPINL